MGSGISRVLINQTSIGIGTNTITPTVSLDVSNGRVIAASINVGAASKTINQDCDVDFSSSQTYMLPPKLTTTQRNGLGGLVAGAMIYNTTTNKHQAYDGTIWHDLY